ncbi:MAG: cobalt/nickel transport system ATP-binding protein [Clostridia bacterium]|nr:cobalt/nickel transport system ATP-binding protein [Clostridia bacterium]
MNVDMISVENLSYIYKDGTKALNNISLKIPAQAKVALLGPNGAGKSTLLLHFNGIFQAQTGVVKVLGQPITKSNEKWVRSKVGFVFQDPDDQVFSSTVWEDVAFGPINMGIKGLELKEKVNYALKVVGMEAFAQKAPQALSYGQKKRVAIAGILAMEPEIIILDEPLAFLDPKGKEDLFNILNSLNKKGTSIIIATHDVNLAAEWADEIIIIKNGSLLAQGEPGLLTDKEIVGEANLTIPIVSQVFDGLEKWDKKLPIRIKEAKNQLINSFEK